MDFIGNCYIREREIKKGEKREEKWKLIDDLFGKSHIYIIRDFFASSQLDNGQDSETF